MENVQTLKHLFKSNGQPMKSPLASNQESNVFVVKVDDRLRVYGSFKQSPYEVVAIAGEQRNVDNRSTEFEKHYFMQDFTKNQIQELEQLLASGNPNAFMAKYADKEIDERYDQPAVIKEESQIATMKMKTAMAEAMKADPNLSIVGQSRGAQDAEAKVQSAYAINQDGTLRINGNKRSLHSLQNALKEQHIHTDMGEGKGFYTNQFHLNVSLPATAKDKSQEQLPAAGYMISQQTQGYSR